jgi:very-short-patch-repair endonuclease
MLDAKRDYIIKTLSRTNRKDYENYIVNAIWNRLARLDIQPVTQQYVKRSDGRYALIDLFFPQLNFGIECDESYHKVNVDHDLKRELTMLEMLGTVQETEDFILRRVDVDTSLESIEKQINAIVDEIKTLLNSKKVNEWNINERPATIVSRQGSLSVNDSVRFRTIVEVAECFGKYYKGMQQCYFKLDQENMIWCPKLSIIKDGKNMSTGSRGWINYLSHDWEHITETREDIGLIGSIEEQSRKPRITFAQSSNSFGQRMYRFIGVYQFSKSESSHNLRVYKRISTKISYVNNELIFESI